MDINEHQTIDLTTLIPPSSTTSPANQQTYKTKNGIKKQKPYKTAVLTPANKKFSEIYAKTNNGTKAVLEAFEGNNYTVASAGVKATRLLKNDNIVSQIEYQRNKLEILASRSVDRVADLIESDNEAIATTNAWKTIEQVQGKAMQKSSNVNFNFTSHVTDKGSEYKL